METSSDEVNQRRAKLLWKLTAKRLLLKKKWLGRIAQLLDRWFRGSMISREVFRGIFEVKRDDDGRWQASVCAGDFGCGGMGNTPQEAVRKLCSFLETEAPLPSTPRIESFLNRGDSRSPTA